MVSDVGMSPWSIPDSRDNENRNKLLNNIFTRVRVTTELKKTEELVYEDMLVENEGLGRQRSSNRIMTMPIQ